jgi:hypothetical protein
VGNRATDHNASALPPPGLWAGDPRGAPHEFDGNSAPRDRSSDPIGFRLSEVRCRDCTQQSRPVTAVYSVWVREHFVNADFDLSLRRRRPPGVDDVRARLARELPMHMLLLGVEGDSILAPSAPDGAFLEYLGRLRIPVPDVRVRPSLTGPVRFTPFGWNLDAENLNECYDHPVPHPPLDVVRRVNGRRFSAEVERKRWGGEHVLGVARSTDELAALLSGRPPGEHGWLAKSEHGNGGFGNRRLRSRGLGAADREAVTRLLREDECLVVEPWRERVLDLASCFEVGEAGTPEAFLAYEVVNTTDGAFVGDIFDLHSPALARWGEELRSTAAVVAAELAVAGYFGPVCVDSFVWNDGGIERLRPVVDINARRIMAAAAERLWRLWSRDRIVHWRLFSTRKLRLPESFSAIEEALGSDAFDPRTRCGTLITSPLSVEGRPPRRLGVLLAAGDRETVDVLDRRFRERFEK